MKNIFTFLLITAATFSFGQNRSGRFHFASFQKETSIQQLSSAKVISEIELIEMRKSINTRKTIGFVFAGVGLAATAFGIQTVAKHRNDPEGTGQTAGILMAVGGVALMAASVPFFIRSKRASGEIDHLRNLYVPAQY